MLIGKRRRRVRFEFGIDRNGRPGYEGELITKGRMPLRERIKRRYERTVECRKCGRTYRDTYHGVFDVTIVDYGLIVPFVRRIVDVEYECLTDLARFDRDYDDAKRDVMGYG